MKNQVQLIAYVDRISGGGIGGLNSLLQGPLAGFSAAFTCCRSSTRSTAPMRASIRSIIRKSIPGSERGTICERWAALAEITADLIVNHVSTPSPQFEDFSPAARRRRTRACFSRSTACFPTARAKRTCSRIYRPRPGLPFTYIAAAEREPAPVVDHVHAAADRYRRARAPQGSGVHRRYSRPIPVRRSDG